MSKLKHMVTLAPVARGWAGVPFTFPAEDLV